jgi:hypothetical protein
MIGRKVDLKLLQDSLKRQNIINVRTAEFSQGRTTRWGLAWTFSSIGLQQLVVFCCFACFDLCLLVVFMFIY